MTQRIQKFTKRYVNVLGVLIGLTVVSSILFYTGCGMTSSPNIRTNPTPTPDTTPPTSTITSPTSGATRLTRVGTTISGEASDTGGGTVARVEVSVDGGATFSAATVFQSDGRPPGTLSWFFGWTPATPGPVTIRSRAVDSFLNVQNPPAQITVTVIQDSTPPTSTITSPTEGEIVSPGDGFIIGTASDAGGGTVDHVDVSLDGGTTYSSAVGNDNWSFKWRSHPSQAGPLTIKSRAVDNSGNVQDPPTEIHVIINGPPTSTITSPKEGDKVLIKTSVDITGTASDAGGSVVRVEVSVNGGANYSVAMGTNVWSFNWEPSSPGPVTIKSRAVDNTGNVQNPPTEIHLTVDAPPISTITSPKEGATVAVGIPVNITGTAFDPGDGSVVRVEVSVDDGANYSVAMGTNAWSFNWEPSSPGPVTIKSRAVDNTGNVQDSPAEIRVTVRTPITIRVPSDQLKIQSAIDVADFGDKVLVAPGTYSEHIDFRGKAITVTSESGSDFTTIDAGNTDPVVSFTSQEGRDSVLNGFTLQNGRTNFSGPGAPPNGGGIVIQRASPKITNNVITNNHASMGSGIGINFGSPLIQLNKITGNINDVTIGGGGGGILISGEGSAEILDNEISDNVNATGGGIYVPGGGATPIIKRNVIKGNSVPLGAFGGGIYTVNNSSPLIVQNLITGNHASYGGGVYWAVSNGVRGPILVNNTIADNDVTTDGSGIYADGADDKVEVTNNIIVAKPGQTGLFCGPADGHIDPIIRSNNIFSSGGMAYGGSCADMKDMNGNISADPLFTNPTLGDYHLQQESPSIDAGDNQAPNLPDKDLDGDPRILDGDGNGTETIDMGVDEFLLPPGLKISLLDESNRNSTKGRYPFICDLRPWTRTLSRRSIYGSK